MLHSSSAGDPRDRGRSSKHKRHDTSSSGGGGGGGISGGVGNFAQNQAAHSGSHISINSHNNGNHHHQTHISSGLSQDPDSQGDVVAWLEPQEAILDERTKAMFEFKKSYSSIPAFPKFRPNDSAKQKENILNSATSTVGSLNPLKAILDCEDWEGASEEVL